MEVNNGPGRYAVLIEASDGGFRAWIPDLPGCTARGMTIAEVERFIRVAAHYHVQGIREQGQMVPPARSNVVFIPA